MSQTQDGDQRSTAPKMYRLSHEELRQMHDERVASLERARGKVLAAIEAEPIEGVKESFRSYVAGFEREIGELVYLREHLAAGEEIPPLTANDLLALKRRYRELVLDDEGLGRMRLKIRNDQVQEAAERLGNFMVGVPNPKVLMP